MEKENYFYLDNVLENSYSLLTIGEESNDHQSGRLCTYKKHYSSPHSKVYINNLALRYILNEKIITL